MVNFPHDTIGKGNAMPVADDAKSITYEQFRGEWLADIDDSELTPLQKGRRFGANLVSDWLDVTTDDDDFFICDGSGDGGIDIAYLQRAGNDGGAQDDNAIEGDTWYIVQSKYGSAFSGSETIITEGRKIISTLRGQNQNVSDDTRQLLRKLDSFRSQATEADRMVLVFATTDPISLRDRSALDDVKTIGRSAELIPNFDVEEVSIQTIWEMQEDVEPSRISVPVKGNFVEQSSNLLVGTVSLMDLFDFLKAYRSHTGNLDQLYEKNVRQFLGNRLKINKGIKTTLDENPDKFGLYNNGITIVVSSFDRSSVDGTVTMYDPYVVNGCQTTRTIWQVLDSKLQSGGGGQDAAIEKWKELVRLGGVVTKIVSSDEAEIQYITRYTNSQTSVRDQDFLALDDGFRGWATEMEDEYNIFLEIQRGGASARKAREKQHPNLQPMADYVNAFDLMKVYGAGWLGEPGSAFNKNAPFLPDGAIYKRMMERKAQEPPFGYRDLRAAYKIKCVADEIGFGRRAKQPSRRQSRFLFYHIIMSMLNNVILLTSQLRSPQVSASDLTDAVLKLALPKYEEQIEVLSDTALAVLDQYLTPGGFISVHDEDTFTRDHDNDLNRFLKSESLGKENHSPLLVQLLAQQNIAFSSIRLRDVDGRPTQREFVARALLEN